MKLISGKTIAADIRETLRQRIESLKEAEKRLPKLSVILVGDDPASATYVRNKERACAQTGILSETIRMSEDTTQQALLEVIRRLNADETVDGILVQLPLPAHIEANEVLMAIDPGKDVDGFHPVNVGKMMTGMQALLPCTPKGVIRMLEAAGYDDLSGMRATVIGRSNIVGKPVAQLLLAKHATVTIVHSHTARIAEVCAEADVVVAAIGRPKLIGADWIKEGAVVIDVGINRDEHGKLCGDVDFEQVKDKAAAISPVPGGVGPMTIAMLLENTLEAYAEHEKGGRGYGSATV